MRACLNRRRVTPSRTAFTCHYGRRSRLLQFCLPLSRRPAGRGRATCFDLRRSLHLPSTGLAADCTAMIKIHLCTCSLPGARLIPPADFSTGLRKRKFRRRAASSRRRRPTTAPSPARAMPTTDFASRHRRQCGDVDVGDVAGRRRELLTPVELRRLCRYDGASRTGQGEVFRPPTNESRIPLIGGHRFDMKCYPPAILDDAARCRSHIKML